ncbi:MAG: alpha/beta hydrolase [Marinoscillum sp.]
MTILNIPGWKNSGKGHWQTIWEANDPLLFKRIQQNDWLFPKKEEWVPIITKALQNTGPDVIVTAHSIGVMAFVHAALDHQLDVKGALLVAPSDPERSDYPKEIEGFAPVPLSKLPFPTIVVASNNDPAVCLERAKHFAHHWRSSFDEVKGAGHFKPEDGLGEWAYGQHLWKGLL